WRVSASLYGGDERYGRIGAEVHGELAVDPTREDSEGHPSAPEIDMNDASAHAGIICDLRRVDHQVLIVVVVVVNKVDEGAVLSVTHGTGRKLERWEAIYWIGN